MMNVKNPFKVQNGVLVFKALLGLMTLKYVSVKNKKYARQFIPNRRRNFVGRFR